MKIFAISDLHLSFSSDKPMDIFGDIWENHFDEIKLHWENKVSENDIVLIAGDISWAMNLCNAKIDLEEISKLKGKKIIIRGNHDYWWSSYAKVKSIVGESIFPLQNNAIKFENFIFCGTKGWTIPEKEISEENKKYIDREAIRLSLSLEEAKKLKTEDDEIIVLMHYPPFNCFYEDSVFTDIIKSYEIKTVIYGHLHGKDVRKKMKVNKGITNYFLTSCDQLNNKLLELK